MILSVARRGGNVRLPLVPNRFESLNPRCPEMPGGSVEQWTLFPGAIPTDWLPAPSQRIVHVRSPWKKMNSRISCFSCARTHRRSDCQTDTSRPSRRRHYQDHDCGSHRSPSGRLARWPGLRCTPAGLLLTANLAAGYRRLHCAPAHLGTDHQAATPVTPTCTTSNPSTRP